MLGAISSEWGQGPFWILRVNAIWSGSVSTVPCIPAGLRGIETYVKGISPVQLGQRSKRSNTWGKTTQSHTASAFPLSPYTQGTCFFLDCRQFFYSFFLTLLWKFVSNISWYHVTYYFLWFSQHAYKEMFFMKCSLPFYFALKSNWAEHFNGIHSVDNVTSESFISVKNYAFSILP